MGSSYISNHIHVVFQHKNRVRRVAHAFARFWRSVGMNWTSVKLRFSVSGGWRHKSVHPQTLHPSVRRRRRFFAVTCLYSSRIAQQKCSSVEEINQ
jgi:hypothetical protein